MTQGDRRMEALVVRGNERTFILTFERKCGREGRAVYVPKSKEKGNSGICRTVGMVRVRVSDR